MKTVLITGATSGIGLEFARYYASKGCALILAARRRDRLIRLQQEMKVPVKILNVDLASEENCMAVLRAVEDHRIDIFINNAGFGTCGRFVDTDLAKEIAMLRVNDMAMHILFKGMVRKMEAQGGGTILNVASSAGMLPGGPYMAAYYASKAYVVSLTRAVAAELREAGSPVYVCALCPGPVDTEFNENADVVSPLKGISAARCVREAIRGMRRHRTILVPSLTMKLAMAGQNLIPASALVRMTGRQQKKKMGESYGDRDR